MILYRQAMFFTRYQTHNLMKYSYEILIELLNSVISFVCVCEPDSMGKIRYETKGKSYNQFEEIEIYNIIISNSYFFLLFYMKLF